MKAEDVLVGYILGRVEAQGKKGAWSILKRNASLWGREYGPEVTRKVIDRVRAKFKE